MTCIYAGFQLIFSRLILIYLHNNFSLLHVLINVSIPSKPAGELTFLKWNQGWQVIWNVVLPFIGVSGCRRRKLQHIVFAYRKERRLMGKGHGLQIVDVVLQLAQVHPHESEGLAEVIQHRICSSIWRTQSQGTVTNQKNPHTVTLLNCW